MPVTAIPPLSRLACVAFPVIAIIHLYVSPFTKVEESFNIQAVHDILEYGVPTSDAAMKFKTLFDHTTFPGAVPRTFIGSLILSGLAKPQIWLDDLVGKAAQFNVRAVLGGLNGFALACFGMQVHRAFGPITSSWYVVLQASQFHVWYYASRTLPNMFAFFLSTLGMSLLLPVPASTMGPVRRTKLGLYFITIATVIFRSELAILLFTHCAWLFLRRETFEGKVLLIRNTFIPAIVPGFLIALLLTIMVDTYFWQSDTYIWPELSAFLSNVFPSKDSLGASAWGTSPWYHYFVVALPRLLMNQFFMVDFFFAFPQTYLDPRVFDILIPSYAYVLIYSILPHKETRFLFPIMPSLTLVAAMTCTRLTINMDRGIFAKVLFCAAVISTTITAFISHTILLPLSAQNYPGGQALETLHAYYHWNYQTITPLHNANPSHPQIHVHLTNLALQSGVTRFLEQPPPQNETADITINAQYKPVVQGYHNPTQNNEQQNPIVLPGDDTHPALTMYPKRAAPSSTPPTQHHRSYANPTWIYDKSPISYSTPSTFWSAFDFIIVENPSTLQVPLIGRWSTISQITSLSSRPVLILPPDPSSSLKYHRRYDPPYSEHLDYWTSWTQYEHLPGGSEEFETVPYETGKGGTTWLIERMYPAWLAIPLTRVHDLLHDVLRLDLGVTRGYWIELPMITRLWVLRNCERGGEGCGDAVVYPLCGSQAPAGSGQRKIQEVENVGGTSGGANIGDDDQPALIEATFPDADTSQHRTPLEALDALGPLVVNKDGTLSRLENWRGMNEQERRKTVEYLRKRNMLRMDGAGEGGAAGARV